MNNDRTSAAGLLFSVIIPARNEEQVIGRCLDSLLRMEFPRDRFEVILVDNGSHDRTVAIAGSFASSLKLTIASRPGGSIGAARNFGAALARGTYLGFLDADCLPSRLWLSEAAAIFGGNPGCVIGAPYAIPEDSGWVARAWYSQQTHRKRGNVSYVPAGNLLVRKEDFRTAAGFNESLRTNEDYEFCQRSRAAGLSVRAFPQLKVCHLGTPQTLSQFYRKQRFHGADVFRVFLAGLPRLRNFRPVVFALYTLGCLIGVAAGALDAALHDRAALLVASVAGLLAGSIGIALTVPPPRKKPADLLRMAAVFLTFGVARAVCLAEFGLGRSARRS